MWRDPERHSGAACFYGTRVPIRILFDYLAEGEPLAHFLDAYPHIERDAAPAVVRLGGACLAQLAGGRTDRKTTETSTAISSRKWVASMAYAIDSSSAKTKAAHSAAQTTNACTGGASASTGRSR
jgi:hypothetical protein